MWGNFIDHALNKKILNEYKAAFRSLVSEIVQSEEISIFRTVHILELVF